MRVRAYVCVRARACTFGKSGYLLSKLDNTKSVNMYKDQYKLK